MAGGRRDKIYVFQKPDGSWWAEYSLEKAELLGKVRKTINSTDPLAVLANPGKFATERVKALAQRILSERPKPITEPIEPYIIKRSLWGRLKWALYGR